MHVVTIFCMGCICWILLTGLDTEPAEAAVTMGFGVLMGTVGSYVFGAVWEEQTRRSGRSGRRAHHSRFD